MPAGAQGRRQNLLGGKPAVSDGKHRPPGQNGGRQHRVRLRPGGNQAPDFDPDHIGHGGNPGL